MKNENTKNNIIAWNSDTAVDYACRARYSIQTFAQVENISNATEASIVLKTLDALADNAEFIRAKVMERMQEIKDFGNYKNITEWAVAEGFGRSTVYKYIDTALLITPDGKRSIAPERENGADYAYSRLKVFAEKVKPWAKEKASRLAKLTAKEKKQYWGDIYEECKDIGVEGLTKIELKHYFLEADRKGAISPGMPIKTFIAAIDVLTGKAVIDNTADDTPADNTADDTPADDTPADNTAKRKKAIKLTAEEWGVIVALCDRIKAGESVTELPADVVKVLTAHS